VGRLILYLKQLKNFMKTTTPKKIIVTGGYGFIGSRFVQQVLQNTSYNVKIIDKMTYAADKSRVHPSGESHFRLEHSKIDICDVDANMLRGAHYIVNFAAESHVDNSIKDGKPFIKSNVEGVLNLLDCAKDLKYLKKFVQISTDEVYGDMYDLRGRQSADESFSIRPSSYYSASKASADLLVQSAARTHGIPYLITRSCNNFGPNQHPEKLLPLLFECIKEGKEVPIYGKGFQSREWIHVDDNVEIILELMFSRARNEVYNIGSGYHYKNIEIVNFVGHLLGEKVKYKYVKDRLGHDKAYRLDTSKVGSFLGTKIYQTLEGFLKDEVKRITGSSNRR